jgi:hypothetical protein
MTRETSLLAGPPSTLTSFFLYRWENPATTADYPFLAVAADRSAVLSLGNYGVGFDWGVPDEAAAWLAADFGPTGDRLDLDLATVQYLLDTTFVGGTEFGLMTFDRRLTPNGLQLSLADQEATDQGPEYLIQGFGSYQRFYREREAVGPVVLSERAMLDVCVSTFAELAAQCGRRIAEPPPPRYRPSGPRKPAN